MELGNLLMGHSRGEYSVDRDKWSGLFESLFDEIRDKDGFLEPFENDTFVVRLYDWDAECTCEHEGREEEWWKTNDHAKDCFIRKISAFSKAQKDPYSKEGLKGLRAFLKEHGVPYEGCMVHCDCGTSKAYAQWLSENYHDPNCRLVLPNFHHKPTGYSIMIYKRFFRDSYANMDLKPKEVHEIVQDCLRSLKNES